MSKAQTIPRTETASDIRERFRSGAFPVATTQTLDKARPVDLVLGLVACRGYDHEKVFFGLLAQAASRGADAVTGYREQVAFHPDGNRYYSCTGTAVCLARKR